MANARIVRSFIFLSFNVSAAESVVERLTRLYGISSSEEVSAPCELDDKNTMRKYIDSSVADLLHENPALFEDGSVINRHKIPGDIVVLDEQGFYVNDRPTRTFFLPEADKGFEGIGISCVYSACRWMVRTMCTVISLSGEQLLVYWGRGGELVYVLKKDFVLLEKIK